MAHTNPTTSTTGSESCNTMSGGRNPKPWVVVTHAGTDLEDIWNDYSTFAEASTALKEMDGDDGADIMKRLDDGILTTDY